MSLRVPFVDLKIQYQNLKAPLDEAMAKVISSTEFIGFSNNHFVLEFEKKFSDFLGVKHFIACANGTDSLEMILKALGIGPGDEVIVPANTWISTSECVSTVGAQVVFVDVKDHAYTMDPGDLQKKISAKTKAIIPVHLYGMPAEMAEIMSIASESNIHVIEDCAQAHGARYHGQMCGTFGVASSYSFFPGKNLGAYGDAGGIGTNDAALAEKLRMLRNHGRVGKYDHSFEGRNSRMDGLQAAVLSVKLPHLRDWTRARQNAAALYHRELGAHFKLPEVPGGFEHIYHLFVIQLPEHCSRERVISKMAEQGIETKIHYPLGLPFTKAYSHLGHQKKDFPVVAATQDRILSLPIYPEITEDQILYVVQSLKTAVGWARGS